MSPTVLLALCLAFFAFLLFLLLTAGELRCRQVYESREQYKKQHKEAMELLSQLRERFLAEEELAAEQLRADAVELALNPPPEPEPEESDRIAPPPTEAVVEEILAIADEDPMAVARSIQILLGNEAELAVV